MKIPRFLRNVRQITHKKIDPIVLYPGDSITLTYTDENGVKHHVLTDKATEQYRFTEAIVFAVEDDEYRALGGAFLESR